jgi:hypothetical protein
VKRAETGAGADSRLKRLAGRIEALADKDERSLRMGLEIAQVRRAAALEIHAVCAAFAEALNRLLTDRAVVIDPSEVREEGFGELNPRLIQINVRGRIMQVEFHEPDGLLSTEEFRIPYALAGSVRAFNQELLDKDIIEEQLLFYTVEKHRRMWRFFDPRTYRSGPFDEGYLISLMEQIV